MEHIEHKGLSHQQVEQLRRTYGFNEIPEKTEHFLRRLFKKVSSPIPLMIEIALVLSLVVQRWEDFFIILLLLLVNLSVDLFQEQRAHSALQALKKTLAPTAMVVRDAILQEIDARELLPGDVVKMNIGNVVPADVRILDGTELLVDQSAVTGESLPVTLGEGDVLLTGSIIQKGAAYAEVVAIGRDTAMGENIALVAQAELEQESHFQQAIIRIGKFLITLSSLLVVFTTVVLILKGEDALETLRFALVLAIASIPVALPAVLSVTMAIGANLLARRHTIVSNFRAIEELAGVSHLCVDKTGTLTKNEIAVSEPILYQGHTEEELFVFAYLALEDGERSPIERAVHAHVLQHGHDKLASQYVVKEFVPFDPVKKTTEALFEHDGEEVRILMGAPQKVAERCHNSTYRKKVLSDVDALASDGFRSLAVAVERSDECLPVGIIPLMDPPREDSKQVIEDLKRRGIIIKMLTGDNMAIARYIGKILNIGTTAVDRAGLKRSGGTADAAVIHDTAIFAEVVPADKFRIVKTLQAAGNIVAMTGDGVNDAPALKKADVGIAVSGATPAARSASDLILLDSGLSVIKEAVDQARKTFGRMQAYATFRIAETVRIVFFIALAVLIFDFSPLSAAMVILLALLNDIPVLAIAYDNVPVQEKPVRWQLSETLAVAFVLGITGLVSSFLLLYYLNLSGWEVALIQTVFFVKMDVAGHSTLYLTRTGEKHFWARPFPSLKFFIPAFSSRLIGSIIAYFGILMPALPLSVIAWIWVYATIWFVLNDQIKVTMYKLLRHYRSKKHQRS